MKNIDKMYEQAAKARIEAVNAKLKAEKLRLIGDETSSDFAYTDAHYAEKDALAKEKHVAEVVARAPEIVAFERSTGVEWDADWDLPEGDLVKWWWEIQAERRRQGEVVS